MTDTMKKFLLPLAVLAMLTGCNHFTTEVYQDNLTMAICEDCEDSLTFNLSVEYVTGGMSADAMDLLNRYIVYNAFDLEEFDAPLVETAEYYREGLMEYYLNECAEAGMVSSWEDDTDAYFLPDWKGWKNYLIRYYSYRGGAHGIQTESYLVFNAKTGELIKEPDLFKEGYEEPVTEMLRLCIKDSLPFDEEMTEMLWLDNVVPNGNFFLDKEGITWSYQPYEVGPYALGIVTATLSWDDLKPYLL